MNRPAVIAPTPYDASGRRYSTATLPPYRHVPGLTPHPRRHPLGHQFGTTERTAPPFSPEQWPRANDYLYGVDLYNFAFFWEAHEAWERVWKTTPPGSMARLFLHGLIQIAAALLKRTQDKPEGMNSLSRRGLAKLQRIADSKPLFCGVDLPEYTGRMEALFVSPAAGDWPVDPRLHLELP